MRKPAIARMWQGRMRASVADSYQKYHYEEGVRKLRAIPGNLGVQVFRQTHDGVTTFVTISYWPSREEIRAYAGPDIEKPHHLPRDAEYLLELPDTVVLVDEWGSATPLR